MTEEGFGRDDYVGLLCAYVKSLMPLAVARRNLIAPPEKTSPRPSHNGRISGYSKMKPVIWATAAQDVVPERESSQGSSSSSALACSGLGAVVQKGMDSVSSCFFSVCSSVSFFFCSSMLCSSGLGRPKNLFLI
jgi:hypothetical protein